jgi:hypothetical protein
MSSVLRLADAPNVAAMKPNVFQRQAHRPAPDSLLQPKDELLIKSRRQFMVFHSMGSRGVWLAVFIVEEHDWSSPLKSCP